MFIPTLIPACRYLGCLLHKDDTTRPQRSIVIFMEYMSGGSIHTMLQRFGTFATNPSLKSMQPTCLCV